MIMHFATSLLFLLSTNVVTVTAYDAQPPDCKELALGEEYIHPGEDALVSDDQRLDVQPLSLRIFQSLHFMFLSPSA
jgi:hypothetical protein